MKRWQFILNATVFLLMLPFMVIFAVVFGVQDLIRKPIKETK